MIIKSEYININNLKNNDIVIDIETTGFSSKQHKISMLGMVGFDTLIKSFYFKQIFSENHDDEINLLSEFLKTIDSNHRIMSFNGLQFDIPFIQNRLTHHGFDYVILKHDHIDLFDYMRKNKIFTGTKPVGQKALEKQYMLERPFEMSGKTAVDLYKSYVKKPNIEIYEKMSLYNRLDVLYLAKLFDIYFNSQNLKTISYFKGETQYHALIDSISQEKDIITIELTSDQCFEYEMEDIRNYYVLKWNRSNLSIKMNTITGLISEQTIGTCFNYSDFNKGIVKEQSILKDNLILVKDLDYKIENLKIIIKEMILDALRKFNF